MALVGFRAPALPLPKEAYDRRQQDQMLNALRIYFNQLDSTAPVQSDYFIGGGWRLKFPHISASDSTDQRTTNNTATVVKWNTLDSGFGWTLNSPGSATADYAGVYTIRYSLQFANTDNGQHTATVWLKITTSSGTADVPNSATSFSVPARKNPSTPGFICAYSEATFAVAVGDEIELYWATDKADVVSPAADGVFMFHDAAQTTPFARPAIPSAIGSITFISALP